MKHGLCVVIPARVNIMGTLCLFFSAAPAWEKAGNLLTDPCRGWSLRVVQLPRTDLFRHGAVHHHSRSQAIGFEDVLVDRPGNASLY